MTHHDLTDLLERAADRTDVGAPPVGAMLRGVRRRRHRRAVLAGAGLTLVAVTTAIAVPVLTNPPSHRTPAEPQTVPDSDAPTSAPAFDLEGTYVVAALVRRNGRPAPTSYGHTKFHLVFRERTVHAFDGCNELSGGYALHGESFELKGHVFESDVGCMPGPAPLFERIGDVVSVARDQGGTYLEDSSGAVVIALVRR